VTNRAHVHVGLGTFEFTFCHFNSPEKSIRQSVGLAFPQCPDAPATGNRESLCEDDS